MHAWNGWFVRSFVRSFIHLLFSVRQLLHLKHESCQRGNECQDLGIFHVLALLILITVVVLIRNDLVSGVCLRIDHVILVDHVVGVLLTTLTDNVGQGNGGASLRGKLKSRNNFKIYKKSNIGTNLLLACMH